jgi:hypothetical protein
MPAFRIRDILGGSGNNSYATPRFHYRPTLPRVISMDGSSVDKLRDELERLMKEHIEATQRRTFLGITPEEVLQEKERLERIREVSADFLHALKNLRP